MKNLRIRNIGIGVAMVALMPQGVQGALPMWMQHVEGRTRVEMPAVDGCGETISLAKTELSRSGVRPYGRLELKKRCCNNVPGKYEVLVKGDSIIVSSCSEIGLLYGSYDMLRQAAIAHDTVWQSAPFYGLRILNHWDNPDGTVERGYAGKSIWKWEELPGTLAPRYEEYARANASIGINGTVLNNVNASPSILTHEYLEKTAAIANVMRPYGIRVYLSVNFASPMVIGGLKTADPRDKDVEQWWQDKCEEIYGLIPDFGGFLVKANSEGQPGPMDYGRTHAEGANMLARALKPHDGIVMWRAFVYSPGDADRAKQAYLEFKPLDGQFDDNVIVQIKNGPIDFQPREPYSPLFGAMPATRQMSELQVTQEYLGHANHLAFLAPMWQEFFSYVKPSQTVGIAGVANIGDSECWTGNPMAQSNWYAFGRMAWNPNLESAEIADEWIRLSMPRLADDAAAYNVVTNMMLESREAVVDYMMPLGLHHIFAWGHHYGPEPWCEVEGARPDWLPTYYHRADSTGLGYDRSLTGSNAAGQYPQPLASQFADIDECPEEFILWFHHVPWDRKMNSGLSLWDELCSHYDRGVAKTEEFVKSWEMAKSYIEPGLYADVEKRLATQHKDARWWRNACLGYFSTFSGRDVIADKYGTHQDMERYRAVSLPISNFESPEAEMLDGQR